MQKHQIFFRANGSSDIGLGHIVRCCALAEMLKPGFRTTFLLQYGSSFLSKLVLDFVDEIIELPDFVQDLSKEADYLKTNILQKEDILVLDGYSFNTDYQKTVKSSVKALVCLDDIHAYHFVADVVINHAPFISPTSYSIEPYTHLLLGAKYAILKKEFLKYAKEDKAVTHFEKSSILICMGGADPDNISLQIANELNQHFLEREIYIVVGKAYKHINGLYDFFRYNERIKIYHDINSRQLIQLMEVSNLAVTSASTIALEYCCIKGNLFLKLIADNQKDIYESLIEKQCALPFEMIFDRYNTGDLTLGQKALIDGKSGERINEIFKRLC